MADNLFGHHISKQFNAELEDIRHRVLAMGGLVEQQIADAIQSLVEGSSGLAQRVKDNEIKVNALEVALDEECTQVLARRQPTASDLRLVIAVIKTITDLERIGDQAEKIARIGEQLAELERPRNQYMELQHLADGVKAMLHEVLDAFARMDAEAAVRVARRDEIIDNEYEAVMRQTVTFMMEDSRSIKRSLEIIWAARAMERIGDHAKNICEYVIYLVKGKDVRHISFDEKEAAARSDR
ncbi:MAG: phosphate signaling complex protein PhoU [Gammaproteobacteria bacterium]|nr:phosphate signaling complex protein PhoU [Gammaproteobacteria bacterium]